MSCRHFVWFPALVVGLTACREGSGVIVDDWGPPAGYALLVGTVQRASGGPAAGIEVSVTRCGSPIGGFLASATTDGAGEFRANAQLPPVGVLPSGIADTLRLRCYVFLGHEGVVRDSVTVRFAATRSVAPETAIHLEVP